jgi:hypothetical protein
MTNFKFVVLALILLLLVSITIIKSVHMYNREKINIHSIDTLKLQRIDSLFQQIDSIKNIINDEHK